MTYEHKPDYNMCVEIFSLQTMSLSLLLTHLLSLSLCVMTQVTSGWNSLINTSSIPIDPNWQSIRLFV